ncbi:YajQ family cyclic di-GMP-binding protein [Legionella sp.]|uniref:YajQ family cyclic di-GMP-binding protein n=1 Tax=Legionella sp. TaxID=459 RepID=UPI003C9AA8D1
MPSFDIVSETSEVELRNAVDNAVREMGTRFDFRGVESSIDLKELTVTLRSESDFQVRQLEDLFRTHCTKRSLDASGADIEDEPLHSGKFYSLNMTFKQGIDQPTAKEIVKLLKEAKLKVQSSIQGDKVRITGKKRDDLQEAIALLKKSDLKLPLQYENFRD